MAHQDGLSLVWYRSTDLRLSDHAPLRAAAARPGPVIPVFCWVDDPARRAGSGVHGALEAWLKPSLAQLAADLGALGSRLVIRRCAPVQAANGGPAELEATDVAEELSQLARETGASWVGWHRSYTPDGRLMDEAVRRRLEGQGCQADGLPGFLLHEPASVDLGAGFAGGHWGTLMPFLRACNKSAVQPALPTAPPASLRSPAVWPESQALAALRMAAVPTRLDGSEGTDWAGAMMAHWRVGEAEAQRLMDSFISGQGLQMYEKRRSRADMPETVSRLSPYLRFGQLSARQLYHAVRSCGLGQEASKTFGRRLHWRDLAYYQLSCFPHMAKLPIRAHYSAHPWIGSPEHLRAWQRGLTGYPMVDAGMRALYATGWMHQSVRMVCASFLVEYLGLSWVHGLEWFHQCLVDADPAINAMMWQNAGRSGIDQWNFVMSPENGSQDPTGEYCRRWLPELARLPNKYIHVPWLAPTGVLRAAGVTLGQEYPDRVVTDLTAARKATVAALIEMRRGALEYNDAGGYDLIRLPSGETTRVFTKQEYRLDGSGRIKPKPVRNNSTPKHKKRKSEINGKHLSPNKDIRTFFAVKTNGCRKAK